MEKQQPTRIRKLIEAFERAGFILLVRNGRLEYEYLGHAEPTAPVSDLLSELEECAPSVMAHVGEIAEDPRPDLAEDSHLWIKVLELARRSNTQIFTTLHGFRCEGAKLSRTTKGLRMAPRIHGGENPRLYGFNSHAEYKQQRNKWLIPLTKEIQEVFRTVDVWASHPE